METKNEANASSLERMGLLAQGRLILSIVRRNRGGVVPESLSRAVLGIAGAFARVEEDSERSGSVCVSYADLRAEGLDPEETADELIREGVAVDPLSDGGPRENTSDGRIRFSPFVIDRAGERIYFERRFVEEKELALAVARFCREPVRDPSGEQVTAFAAFQELDWKTGRADTAQDEAVAFALRHRFLVVTGGPGTGKTSTVARILALLLLGDPGLRIAGAAPTGKAAANLEESLLDSVRRMKGNPEVERVAALLDPKRIFTSTLDRLLIENPSPLPFDVLIVDECSMMDIDLASRLFASLDPKRTRLILLGDKDQLSAVGPGAVFADLSDSSGPVGPWVREFRTSHRFTPGSSVYRLSRAITPEGGGEADFEEVKSVLANSGDAAGGFRISWNPDTKARGGTRLTRGMQEWLRESFGFLLDRREASEATLRIGPYLKAVLDGQKLDPGLEAAAQDFWDRADGTRVLSAVRAGVNGTDAVNDYVGSAVREAGAAPAFSPHYPGRFIMVRRNDPALDLANGDVAIELPLPEEPDKGQELVAWFGNRKRVMRVGLLPEHETAYAITIHKSQGSAYTRLAVALPSGEAAKHGSRELLYTAVTRLTNRKETPGELTVFASEAAIGAAAGRRMRRTGGLSDRLREALAADPMKAASRSRSDDGFH
ncbi:MAG: AAA family ATPase [Sutterellaceae bacterium]|nr:AAA family ATPase [Sutterellaceae bacterium]MDD7441345.1 AAA family ATPase [Sutterellaceae bacterium]MDY2868664.1 AAA family ATPase [Mesosutterella sp.]